jgi:hypothetical protein
MFVSHPTASPALPCYTPAAADRAENEEEEDEDEETE